MIENGPANRVLGVRKFGHKYLPKQGVRSMLDKNYRKLKNEILSNGQLFKRRATVILTRKWCCWGIHVRNALYISEESLEK